jgi:replicative DNA helicase
LQQIYPDDDCGRLSYLNALASSVASASNICRYAEIVRERSILRQLLAVSHEIARSAFDTQGLSATDILDRAESKILKIGDQNVQKDKSLAYAAQLSAELIATVEARSESELEMTGLTSGYRDLDRMTLGFQAGDLIILAARPSMGKSALAMNIAEHALAAHPNKLVLAFSMEMNRNQMFERIAASKGHIPLQLMRSGKLEHEHWSRLSEAMESLIPARLAIDDITNLTPTQLGVVSENGI